MDDTAVFFKDAIAHQKKMLANEEAARRAAEWEAHVAELTEERKKRTEAQAEQVRVSQPVVLVDPKQIFAKPILVDLTAESFRQILQDAFTAAGIVVVGFGKQERKGNVYKMNEMRLRVVAKRATKEVELKDEKITLTSTDGSATFSYVKFFTVSASFLLPAIDQPPTIVIGKSFGVNLSEQDWPLRMRDGLRGLIESLE